MAEVTGGSADFLSRVFREPTSLQGTESSWTREEYIRAICLGGYPEARGLRSQVARSAWYDGYLTTVINRDISDFAEIGKIRAIPRVLGLVAACAGSPMVIADLARSADLDRATVRNYLTYLDTVFLTTEVLPWSTNLTSRLSKTPEIFLTDTGLAAHLLGATETDLRRVGHPALGGLVETFVHAELMKLATVSEVPVSIWQFRDKDVREVDFVLNEVGWQRTPAAKAPNRLDEALANHWACDQALRRYLRRRLVPERCLTSPTARRPRTGECAPQSDSPRPR